MLDDDAAWERLGREYFRPILAAARASGNTLLLDTLAWRAHPDFVTKPGTRAGELARVNELGVRRVRDLVERELGRDATRDGTVLVTGDLGPRGDGYKVADTDLTPAAARDYHRAQIEVLARAGVDLLCAYTMTSVAESVGVTLAARDAGLPVVVSPTVETDGTLPDGTSLGELIRSVFEETAGAPLTYMVNCAHPAHLAPTLARARAAGKAGSRASAACAPTRRGRATPSSTRAPSSTAATRRSSAASSPSCGVTTACASSAAAAAPTPST
ncbi:MAG: homocysteine S-methyltransferase family protein [Deltaproteobacteria bacterium]|nr:homocysteine S-methyltransferase family protein [Deltaproteobacteria bacterium]